jgi:hypothetical protein
VSEEEFVSKTTVDESTSRRKPAPQAVTGTVGTLPAGGEAPRGTPPSESERLLQAAAGFAGLVDPAGATMRQIHALLQQSLPPFREEYASVEAFCCALQLSLAEERLGYVTQKAGMLPPGVERTKCALKAYLDFSLQHDAVGQFCTKARVQFRGVAEQMRQRNALVAMMIAVELSSMGRRHAQESGRMLQAVLMDVVATEALEGQENEKLRAGLMACVRAVTSAAK